MTGFTPKRHAAFGEQIIDQLGHRAMQTLHHRAEIFANLQIAKRVIVIVEQASDPRRESVLRGVVVEAIPEHALGRFACERWEAVAAAGRDKIDLVVEVPVLEAMLVAE